MIKLRIVKKEIKFSDCSLGFIKNFFITKTVKLLSFIAKQLFFSLAR